MEFGGDRMEHRRECRVGTGWEGRDEGRDEMVWVERLPERHRMDSEEYESTKS